MADKHDIIAFSTGGEKILGVVIEHHTNPLDDFFLVYADYALYQSHNSDEDAIMLLDNVIIPACDAALADYVLKRQHLRDINRCHREIEAMIKAVTSKMGDMDSLFDDRV